MKPASSGNPCGRNVPDLAGFLLSLCRFYRPLPAMPCPSCALHSPPPPPTPPHTRDLLPLTCISVCPTSPHPSDDNIVNVRAASRAAPEGRAGSQLALSFTDGLVVDK